MIFENLGIALACGIGTGVVLRLALEGAKDHVLWIWPLVKSLF